MIDIVELVIEPMVRKETRLMGEFTTNIFFSNGPVVELSSKYLFIPID